MLAKPNTRDYMPCNIFEEVMKSLNKTIIDFKLNNPNIDSQRSQSQQTQKINFDIQQFIESNLKMKYIVLLEYSKLNFPDMIGFFLDQAQQLIKENVTSIKEIKTSIGFQLCIYYDLISRCCFLLKKEISNNQNENSSKSETLFNDTISNSEIIKSFLIDQSMLIFHNDFPKELLYVRNQFSKLLSTLGSHYSCFYDFFFQHISQIVSSSTIPNSTVIVGSIVGVLDSITLFQGSSSLVSKYLPSILAPIIRLPGDNDGLNVLLSLIRTTISKTTSLKSSYRQPFSDTILYSILYFFKLHFYLNSNEKRNYRKLNINNSDDLSEIDDNQNDETNTSYDYKAKNKVSQASLLFPTCPNEVISNLAQIIDSWNEKHSKFTWPTQIALLVLSNNKKEIFADPSLLNDHSLLHQLRNSSDEKQKIGPTDVFPDICSFSPAFDDKNRKSLYTCLENFPNLKNYQKEFTSMALLVAFRIYSLSCRNNIARDFVLLYYENFLDYFVKQKICSSITSSEFYTKCIYVDFPICVLFIRKNDVFRKSILPILKEKPDGPLYLAKIIRRLCRQGPSLKFDQIFDEFIDITIWLLNKAESDNPINQGSKNKDFECNQLLNVLITAFSSYPTFTRKVLCMKDAPFNTKNVDIVIESARKHPNLPWHNSFLLFFESFTDTDYFAVINNLLTFLFEMYCKIPLGQSISHFEQSIPKIIDTAAMSPVFQQSLLQMDVSNDLDDSGQDEESESVSISMILPSPNTQHSINLANLSYQQYSGKQSLQFLKNIIPTLEMSALVLIASSNKTYRNYGVNIFNCILNFTSSDSLIDVLNLKIPIDLYHTIVHDVANKNIPTGHESYKNPLRRITFSTASIGYVDVWPHLYQRLISLTTAISPRLKAIFDDQSIVSQKTRQKFKDQTIYEMYLPPLQDDQYFTSELASLNPFTSTLSSTNSEVEETSLKDSNTMSEWIGCASILFAISACPNNNLNRLFNESFILIYEEEIGPMMIGTLPFSLNASHGISYIKKVAEVVDKLRKSGNIGKNATGDILFIQNLMKVVIGFLKQDIFWEKDVISPNIENISSLIQNFVYFGNTIPDIDCRKFCCQLIISIMTLMNKFDTGFEPITRHEIARTILSWLSISKATNNMANISNSTQNQSNNINDSSNSNLNDMSGSTSNTSLNGENSPLITDVKTTKELISNIFSALALLLDNLSFLECIDQNDPRSHDEQAEGVFISYFFVLKAILERNEKGQSKELIPVLTSLLKQNIDLGIYHCISCTFALKDEARAAFITAMASVFKSSSEDDENKANSLIPDVTNLSIGDILFTPGSGLDLIEYLCELVPYSCANKFGAALIETSISKGCQMQLLERMIDMELRQVDPSTKNSLFRGNAVPANAVGSLPRLVGTNWMKKTLRPLFEEVIANCEKGMSYVLDPEIIKANLSPQEKAAAQQQAQQQQSTENKVDPIMEKVNEQLEANRKNVREMLLKATDTIYDAFDSMPVEIIKEAQLIYKKVYAKYGDFAFNILGGFLFLRFLLPPFTLTSIVGLPAVIDEKPRKALVDQCRILNSAINKGTVDDRPEYQCFIDTAEAIYRKFNDMFKKILKEDVKDKKDEITLDLKKTQETYHSVLYSFLDKMDKKLQSGEELLPELNNSNAQNGQNQRTPSINQRSSSTGGTISASASSSINIGEKIEITSSHNDLLNEDDLNQDENEPLISPRMALAMLIMKLQSIGEPEKQTKSSPTSKNQVKKDDKGNKSSSKKSKFNLKVSTFENLMKAKVKPEDISKFSTFLVKEENNAPDGSAIYYMFFDKLDTDDIESRELYLPYYVLKTLNEEKNPKIIIVLILNKFDQSKLPSKNLKAFLNMTPTNRIQKFVLLETNKEFLDFLIDFEKSNDASNIDKVIEIKDLNHYSNVVGFPSKHLPFTCIESLSQANSTHTASVTFKNKYEYTTVRIHRQSIQLISDPISITNKIKFRYIKFIIVSHISSIVLQEKKNNINESDENENENDTCIPFIISTKEGEKFKVNPTNSALYDAVYALRNRPVSLQQLSNKSKKIDELTLQWLMLNLAYTNMIGEEQQPAIRKASLDLTYSIFHAFSFKRSIAITKIPENAIPTYLLNYVVSISEDIATNNSDDYSGFINEFFYEMREMRHTNKNLAYEYLRPWVVIWLNNIEKNPEFTKKMINNIILTNSQSFIGSIMIDNLESLQQFIRIILKQRDQALSNQIVNYSYNMEKEISLFMVDIILKECISNAITSESEKARGNHLNIIIGIISQLLNSNAFYLNNDDKEQPNKCIVSLIYNIIELRLIYSQEVLNKTRDFFGNILRFINRKNEESVVFQTESFNVCESYASREGLKFICNEFSVQQEEESLSPNISSIDSESVYASKRKSHSKFDMLKFLSQKRKWLSCTQTVAEAVKIALSNDQKTTEQLYFIYRDIIDNAPKNEENKENAKIEVARIATAVIFAGSLSGSHAEEFIDSAISLITKKDRKDFTTFYAVTFAFTNLKLDDNIANKKKLLSKLFYTGVITSLYLRTGIPLELIASSLQQFYPKQSDSDSLDINDIVRPTESLEYTESGDTESTELSEFTQNNNDDDNKKLDNSISIGVPDDVISSLVSMTGLPFNENPVFCSLVLISLYSLNAKNLLLAIERIVNSQAINDPFAKVLSLIVSDEFLDEALESEFGDYSSTVMVSCLFILKLAEEINEENKSDSNLSSTSSFHEYLLSLYRRNPDLFSLISMKGNFGKCMMHLIHEPQIRYIFISQCLASKNENENDEQKVKFPSLIYSMIYNNEKNDFLNSFDVGYSYESLKASFIMNSEEIQWWNHLANLKRSKTTITESDVDSLLNAIVDIH